MTKELCHGLPPSRAKGGNDPEISPDPTGHRLRLGPVRYATQNPPAGEGASRRCDRPGTASAQSCKGRGRIKACGTAAGHRHQASRGYGSGSVGPVSVYRGTGAGGRGVPCRKMSEGMEVIDVSDLVPMPPFGEGCGAAVGGYAFALRYPSIASRVSDKTLLCVAYIVETVSQFLLGMAMYSAVSCSATKRIFAIALSTVDRATTICLHNSGSRTPSSFITESEKRRFSRGNCISECSLRSEEHTSELQSSVPISYAVFCLKKKKINYV